MWVPTALVDLFSIGRDTVDTLKQNLAVEQAKNATLERELTTLRVNFDWLRMQINTLQFERTALLEKVYGIKVPAPELVRAPVNDAATLLKNFSFDDVGEDMAKAIGLPTYDKQ